MKCIGTLGQCLAQKKHYRHVGSYFYLCGMVFSLQWLLPPGIPLHGGGGVDLHNKQDVGMMMDGFCGLACVIFDHSLWRKPVAMSRELRPCANSPVNLESGYSSADFRELQPHPHPYLDCSLLRDWCGNAQLSCPQIPDPPTETMWDNIMSVYCSVQLLKFEVIY